MYFNLPRGRQKKNGNQQHMNTPTTMPRVFAAFFSRLNLATFPAGVILELSLRREPSEFSLEL